MNFRNRNEHRVWSTAAVALIISSLTLDLSYGATVTNQGGYSVLVSIDESIPEPENTEQYFQQIRVSVIRWNESRKFAKFYEILEFI